MPGQRLLLIYGGLRNGDAMRMKFKDVKKQKDLLDAAENPYSFPQRSWFRIYF